MNASTVWRRRAAAAGLLAAATVTATTTSGPASAAVPTPTNCPSVYPISQVYYGQPATGYTTSHGRTPEPFSVTVLGVLRDAIAPGIDMILVRTSSPTIRAVGGIWEGMSGSPVYAADGRLLGALSHGLSYGPSRTAGLTPAAAMYRLLSLKQPAPTGRLHIPLNRAVQQVLTSAGAATPAAAASGISPLTTPVFVSGVSSSGLARLQRDLDAHSPVPLALHRGGSAPAAYADKSTVRPGTPFAAALSYGAFTFGAVGTVTAVCNGKALAFGHPMQGMAATTESAHLARVLYVQQEPVGAPYVMANIGGVVGTVDQDRLVGIRARLGVYPKSALVTGKVTASTGYVHWSTTHVPVMSWMPTAAANTIYGGVFATLQKDTSGRAWVHWAANGHRADGVTTWSYDRRDRADAQYDVAYEVGNLLWDPLSRIGDNVVENVTIDKVWYRVLADETFDEYAVTNAGPPLESSFLPGGTITVPVDVRPYRDVAATKTVNVKVPIPADAATGDAMISVSGGAELGLPSSPTTTFDDILAQLPTEPRNDVVVVQVTFADSTVVTVQKLMGLVTRGTAPTQWVTIESPSP